MEKINKIAENNCEKLRNACYTGRIIIMGISPNRENVIQLYCTLGRSDNSKNRHIIRDGEVIKTEPIYKDEKMINSDLLIYSIARQIDNTHIVSNGVQTDTIYDYLSRNKKFEDAMEVLSFEHDEPIFTPRISGITTINNESIEFKLSIIKTIDQNPKFLLKHIYSYNDAIPGIGYCINTYDLEEECKPFCGEPYFVKVFDDIDALSNYYWNLIDKDKRVGLYVKYISIKDGTCRERIINERT